MIQKKAAICFSGQARTLDKCYEYIKLNILDQIGEQGKDFDIFCCTEDDNDSYKVEKFIKPNKQILINSKNVEKIIYNKYGKLIKKNYKKYIYPLKYGANIKYFLQQYYKYKIVNEIKNDYSIKNNINYKYVIRIRYDTLFIDKLNFNLLLKNGIDSKLFVINDKGRKTNEINDQFAIGSKETLDIYSKLFDDFEYIINILSIKPNLLKSIILNIEYIYLNLYSSLLEILKKIHCPKIIIDILFKIFWYIQRLLLKKYRLKNSLNHEKILYTRIVTNNIKIYKIKLNLFLIKKNTITSFGKF